MVIPILVGINIGNKCLTTVRAWFNSQIWYNMSRRNIIKIWGTVSTCSILDWTVHHGYSLNEKITLKGVISTLHNSLILVYRLHHYPYFLHSELITSGTLHLQFQFCVVQTQTGNSLLQFCICWYERVKLTQKSMFKRVRLVVGSAMRSSDRVGKHPQ